jgi:hypothetical protein
MKFTVSAKAVAATAIVAGLLAGAGQASATTFLLKDSGLGKTDILNTTGELTGGDSLVKASKTGVAFTDTALFSVKPGEELTSYSVSNLGTAKFGKTVGIGEITGGTAEIFKLVGKKETPVLTSLINLGTVLAGKVSSHTDYSNQFVLGPGNYLLKVMSTGIDEVAGQGNAKFSVELQGTAVPEPATWGVMLMGFGAIGAAMRGARRKQALAAA